MYQPKTMNISLTPDMYTPSVDDAGNYIDSTPSIKQGIYCPCTCHRYTIYDTYSSFVSHTKTKIHQKWLQQLNDNKANYYVELMKSKETVENQQKIILRLEQEVQKKEYTIIALTENVMRTQMVATTDLLDIN